MYLYLYLYLREKALNYGGARHDAGAVVSVHVEQVEERDARGAAPGRHTGRSGCGHCYGWNDLRRGADAVARVAWNSVCRSARGRSAMAIARAGGPVGGSAQRDVFWTRLHATLPIRPTDNGKYHAMHSINMKHVRVTAKQTSATGT